MSHVFDINPKEGYIGDNFSFEMDGVLLAERIWEEGDPVDYELWYSGIVRDDGTLIYGCKPDDIYDSSIVWQYPDQRGRGMYSLLIDESWLNNYIGGSNIFTCYAYIKQIMMDDSVNIMVEDSISFRIQEAEKTFTYEIDDDIAELPVSGWLPHDTKRNNLYRLMLSNGINIIKGANGDPHFTFVRTTRQDAPEISDSDIFMVGNVEYEKPYSSVNVSEHTYIALLDANPVTLFDNTKEDPVSSKEVWFNQAPVIVSTITPSAGLRVEFATENSAVLTGVGTLTGIPYTHTTRIISQTNAVGDKEKTVSVPNCTLVNTINSQGLLDRLYAFFCQENHIKKIRGEIKYTDQAPGKVYKFKNTFGEEETACLTKMDNKASSFNRASCEFYSGYESPESPGVYKNCIILDKETFAQDGGVFTTPPGVTQMKVVMIGGGTGGNSGSPGENGNETNTYTYVRQGEDISGMWSGGEGGAGGAGGVGGKPGRVKAVNISNPDVSYHYTIGDGGTGGAASFDGSNAGSDGTASTFGSYSTSDAEGSYIPTAGVYNPIYNEYYALNGHFGIAGGQGGARRVGSNDDYTWDTNGADVTGADGTVYHGGITGEPLSTMDGLPECIFTAYGGNGAGAAVGIDREAHTEMDGQSNQEAFWEVVEDGV